MILGCPGAVFHGNLRKPHPPMPRKLKKGYFVSGQFVAEGSELDLELKRELKGGDAPSRTELKRESTELQKLGEDLLLLRPDTLAALDLSDKFRDAIADARQITNFEGKRRQLQFIGKLMRQLEPAVLEAVRNAVGAQHDGSSGEATALHLAEHWRDRLINDEAAFGEWIALHPLTDSQQLRSLIRQARRDAKPARPGEALRHGRAYRDIFQEVREKLAPDTTPKA